MFRDKQMLLVFNTKTEIVINETEIYVPFTTALHIAIQSENISIISKLLTAGASFWISNKTGETALELVQNAKNARL